MPDGFQMHECIMPSVQDHLNNDDCCIVDENFKDALIDSRLKIVYSEFACRTQVVPQVGSPKKLDGTFVEVNALVRVNGLNP